MIKELSFPKEKINLFWLYVDKTPDCWLWTGSTTHNGYGQFTVYRVTYRVHRLSYVLEYGEIDDSILVLHSCDVRLCVRPAHLFAGTAANNTADMLQKARNVAKPGVLNTNSKLTDEDVRLIRQLYSYKSARELAKMFGVSHTTIITIANNTAWRHVE